MKNVLLCVFLLTLGLKNTISVLYEETLNDKLVQCNMYRSNAFSANRTKHQCEKDNYGGNFSYVITELKSHYSNQTFWCFIFIKEDYFKLKFKLWLSHRDYHVNAVSRYLSA